MTQEICRGQVETTSWASLCIETYMKGFERPSVEFSRCIEFDACRYDGSMISSVFVRSLRQPVDPVPT
ncbi:MAG: hypothetical protein A4E45_02303 [Methanosaeta sp. PtaB.Bin039]|nr:MAG: hypothetical protein A4E45_02303 [Methanosaeta sp. PtaB.Bin039]OPY46642.1 MAG: hypothetical protein A4E47_00548 [Methanosaeta sp. PtaU1.Bin028]